MIFGKIWNWIPYFSKYEEDRRHLEIFHDYDLCDRVVQPLCNLTKFLSVYPCQAIIDWLNSDIYKRFRHA
jgi:hypothetical protein